MNVTTIFKPKKSFWILNVLGWGAMTLINIVFQTKYFTRNFDAIYYSFIVTGTGGCIAFLIRYVILKYRVIEKRFGKLLINLAVITIFGTIISVIAYTLLILTFFPGQSFSGMVFLDNLFHFGVILLIWVLIYASFLFFENQQKLRENQLKLSLKLKEAELNNLRTQLSPHFLFNSLNNIYALIRIHPEKAREAILNVSDLLRYVLNYQKMEMVSVKEEMEIVEIYMQLNTLQLNENVQFVIKIHPNLQTVFVPPLSIQLLVENALKHGKIANGAIVSVEGLEENGRKILQVKNPGNLVQKTNEGIGLPNLKHRLSAMYGDQFEFEIMENKGIVISKITLL